MVPKALLAALILAATSSADPSNGPRSFTSFHDESDFVTVRYWVLFLFSWRLSSVNIGSHLFTSCSTSCRSLQWRVVLSAYCEDGDGTVVAGQIASIFLMADSVYIINMTGESGSPRTTPMLVSKGELRLEWSLILAEVFDMSTQVVLVTAPASASCWRAFSRCTVSNAPLKSSKAAEYDQSPSRALSQSDLQ